MRETAATLANEHSSRSHLLLCVSVEGTHAATGTRSRGRLWLVDLAGSERVSKSGATGPRLAEAKHINRSLSALGRLFFTISKCALEFQKTWRRSRMKLAMLRLHLPSLAEGLTGDWHQCLGASLRPHLLNRSPMMCTSRAMAISNHKVSPLLVQH